jgi:hypothetical protein
MRETTEGRRTRRWDRRTDRLCQAVSGCNMHACVRQSKALFILSTHESCPLQAHTYHGIWKQDAEHAKPSERETNLCSVYGDRLIKVLGHRVIGGSSSLN